jgi:NTP pyrophosphatase (non-canonical NTP hydrolase)
MIKPMTDEEVKRSIERAKINRRNEYKGYAEFVESMILTEGADRLVENTLGLVGETGEVAEKIKKKVRDGNIDIQGLQKELGDVIFYWYALHGALGLDPEGTIKMNKEKLTSRKERGTLQGNGDER